MIMQILKYFKEKSFGGYDDAEMAIAVMKVLRIYFMDPLMEEEITEDVEYSNIIVNASSATFRDIQNMSKRKASVPSSFANMLVIIKTFGNLLNSLFIIRCPLLISFHKYVITPLDKVRNNAKN